MAAKHLVWDFNGTYVSNEDDFAVSQRRVCKALGLPDNWFVEVLKDNDWTFVVKIAFVLEGAIKQAALKVLNQEQLRSVILEADLQLSRKILEQHGILSTPKVSAGFKSSEPDTKAFVEQIIKMRNRIVHDLTHSAFTFASYFDPNRRKAFFNVLRPFLRTPRNWDRLLRSDLKRAVVSALLHFVHLIGLLPDITDDLHTLFTNVFATRLSFVSNQAETNY